MREKVITRSSRAATLLILLPAPARARIVAAHLIGHCRLPLIFVDEIPFKEYRLHACQHQALIQRYFD